MYGFVPMIGISGHLALQGLASGSSAVSLEALVVRGAAAEVAKAAERSVALFGEKTVALSALTVLATECAEQGWDGEDAAALDPVAVMSAKRFVRALPEATPLPEFAPEPDGSISLDWMQSRNRLFSLSIGRGNRLAYAWIDGTDRCHGVAHFDGRNVPAQVLAGIQDIAGLGHAGLRAA
jgi:hypothetical protein